MTFADFQALQTLVSVLFLVGPHGTCSNEALAAHFFWARVGIMGWRYVCRYLSCC